MAVAMAAGEALVAFEERDLDVLLAMVDGIGAESAVATRPSTVATDEGSKQKEPLSKTEKARLKSRRFYHRRAVRAE